MSRTLIGPCGHPWQMMTGLLTLVSKFFVTTSVGPNITPNYYWTLSKAWSTNSLCGGQVNLLVSWAFLSAPWSKVSL
ncbi:hypothetical protein KC19_VG150100 [Ceratodon purpureus]|uniref:Uncharacterized protein n=1 Tax=Ceratodon purpureus TaxID=3225 RepID=A0A8T0HRC6_CERPU|nr:hypothetical protein KC19_VG150100 [Ceratodon purpureus]